MKNKISFPIYVVLFFFCFTLTHSQGPTANPLEPRYIKAMDRATLELELEQLKLFKMYDASLQNIYNRAQQEGDLNLLTAVLEEQEHIKNSKTLSKETSEHPSIAKLQEILSRELLQLKTSRAEKIMAASKQYHSDLEAYEKELVIADRIDEAVEIRNLRNGLAETEPVKESMRLLALKDQKQTAPIHFQPPAKAPKEAVRFQNRFYLVIEEPKTIAEAKQDCIDRGGILAQVDSKEVNEFLVELVSDIKHPWYWIGLSDKEEEGKWILENGSPLQYRNWRAGEPNNYGNREHWAVMNKKGIWNDYGPRRKHFYICQWGH